MEPEVVDVDVGCNGAVKGTKPCQGHYSAMYPPTNQQPYQAVYTTANQPMYQPTHPFPNQPINQYPLINQPMYQLGTNLPINQFSNL